MAYIPQLDERISQEPKNFALMGKMGVDKLDADKMSGGEETRLKIVPKVVDV